MEYRSKVAAATASVVPFHCVICFDEFNLTDRTPMVLPCGHTYVCCQCTKRLKRCMECREPLYLTAVNKGTNTSASSSSTALVQHRGPNGAPGAPTSRFQSRYSHGQHHSPPNPPHSSPPHGVNNNQIPLPIPKNVVLIAMMEAAARQELETKKKATESQDDVENDDDDEEEFNLDHIISGMATLSGPCGTYCVAVDSLKVLSEDPKHPVSESYSFVTEDENGIAVVPESLRSGEEKKQDTAFGEDADSPDLDNQYRRIQQAESFTLTKGQKVQVVDFEDGVAKLARGEGYILASKKELVKVGGPLESVCRLEGLLQTVSSRGRDLQSTLDENRQIEISLRTQIEAQLSEEPNHPVITDPLPPTPEPSPPPMTPIADARGADFADNQFKTPEKSISLGSGSLTLPASTVETPRHDRNEANGSPGFPRSPNSIDNSDLHRVGLPGYRRTVSEDDLDHLAFGCGAAFLGTGTASLWGTGENLQSRNDMLPPADPASDFRDATNTTRTRRHDDEPFLMMHAAPTLTSSFDQVDFRTGLSGHRGVAHYRTAKSSPTPRGRSLRMMSEHRGIAHARVRGPPRRNSPPSSPHARAAIEPRFSPFPGTSEP